MKQKIIKLLDPDLKCIRCKLKNKQIIFAVKASREKVPCSYCGKVSSKMHSMYQCEIQDISIQDKQTIVLLNVRRMFYLNPAFDHKTFSERFDFIATKGRKNKGLLISAKVSSVSVSVLLKESSINI